MPSIEKEGIKEASQCLKRRAKVRISIMKSKDSRGVLSVFRLRKRYNKQKNFSLNNNTTLPWKGNTKINVLNKGVTLAVKIFYKLLYRGCSD